MKKNKYTLDIKLEYKYIVDYDIEDYYPCQNGSDCCNNDYCRCREITGGTVTDVNFDAFYRDISSKSKKETIKDYCLERGLRLTINPEHFTVSGEGGYYGQEATVSFIPSYNLKNLIDKLSNGTNAECIEYIFELEYGTVLKKFKNKKWYLSDVSINNIENSSNTKLDLDKILKYKKEENFSAFCHKKDDKYYVIDGRHRVAAAQKLYEEKMEKYKRGRKPTVNVSVIYYQ